MTLGQGSGLTEAVSSFPSDQELFLNVAFPPEEGYLSTGLLPLKTKTEDCGSKYHGIKSIIFL